MLKEYKSRHGTQKIMPKRSVSLQHTLKESSNESSLTLSQAKEINYASSERYKLDLYLSEDLYLWTELGKYNWHLRLFTFSYL